MIQLFSVESRATTPLEFERSETQINIEEESAESHSVSINDNKTQECSKMQNEPSKEQKPAFNAEKSVKLIETKESGTGTSSNIASSNTKSDVPSQKSKLTGKTRTGWI